jgi:predicted acetyltransferase
MTDLRRWSHRTFPPALQWQAVSFIRTVWPSVDGGNLREAYPGALHPTYYTVTHQDDLLVSLAASYTVQVAVDNTALTAACLGNVFTYPAWRGRGFGRQVVDAATNDIYGSGVDVAALLCDDPLQPFYEASGWQAVPGSATVTADGEALDSLRMMLIMSETARTVRHDLTTRPLTVPSAW